jgi:hypothetical protein
MNSTSRRRNVQLKLNLKSEGKMTGIPLLSGFSSFPVLYFRSQSGFTAPGH